MVVLARAALSAKEALVTSLGRPTGEAPSPIRAPDIRKSQTEPRSWIKSTTTEPMGMSMASGRRGRGPHKLLIKSRTRIILITRTNQNVSSK
jgi:hypothetical protein